MPGLIVHEWIEATGGAERVVDAWSELYPDATIHCLWSDAPDRYPNHVVSESWMAKSWIRRSKPLALPAMALHWRHINLSSYDWVLVSSHSFAHHVAVAADRAGIPAYIYVHTPARYLWAPELDTRASGWLGRISAPALRALDRSSTRPLASYASNSEYIKQRIQRSWNIGARVIYPPVTVDLPQQTPHLTAEELAILGDLPDQFILGVSRFVPQKRLDAVIEYASALGDRHLVICGRGPEEFKLRELAEKAGISVSFVISPSDALLRCIMTRAELFVFPPVEDFGILPVEALAAHTPSAVNAEGGAVESVLTLSGGVAHSFANMTHSEAKRLYLESQSLDMSSASQGLQRFSSDAFKRQTLDWMTTPG